MRSVRVARIFLGLLSMVMLASAQRLTWYERLLLLPAAQQVSGVVVDSAGKPVAGAHIDHSDVTKQEQLFTDEQGRFRFQTRAPAMVVRKLGFDGKLVRTGNARALRIVLDPETRSMPACTSKCEGLKSSGSAFCLPATSGFTVSAPGTYFDSVMRVFTLPTRDGQREILVGSGPTWSSGIPYTGDVWESSDYHERAYRMGDSDVVDARGKSPAGKLWRFLGRFGESASYYEADAASAAVLDRVLDGVCVTPGSSDARVKR